MQKLLRHALTLLLLFSFANSASANVGEAFGFGSRGSALAGAMVASGAVDGFSAYANPALLARNQNKKLVLSFGLISMTPSFLPINNVNLQNNYTSSGVQSGNVDTSYRSTLGQSLGFAYRLLPDVWNLHLGLTSFLPLSQAAYMDTGEPFIPEYVLYRARTQRPQFSLALGAAPSPVFQFGAGFQLTFGLTSMASTNLETNLSSGKPSSMRFSSSLKPKAAPYFGFLVAPTADHENLALGLVIRIPVASSNQMTVRSRATIAGAPVDFNFTSNSALFYDPLSVELGASFKSLGAGRAYAQLDYQAWSKFAPPSLSVKNCDDSGCGTPIAESNNPTFRYRNVVVPRFGHELSLGSTDVRIGYAYWPSFMRDLPTGAGNYLDPPKHMVNAGAGFKFARFLGYDLPSSVDLHLAYHQLVTQKITKTPGDELGSGSGDLKVGAPGYSSGGRIYGGGLSLTVAF